MAAQVPRLYNSWHAARQTLSRTKSLLMNGSFEKNYPYISAWVKDHGWIEIGQDDYSQSFVRALDLGGMIWESSSHYETVDHALQELEAQLEKWMRENL